MSRSATRRQFLGQSITASVLGVGFFSSVIRSEESKSPNEKLNIAAVGVANKGGHNLEELAGQNIVALCDVDESHLKQAAQRFGQAKHYRDYRRMLEAEAQHADAVVVSTADHTHAPAASAALALGKHVYCEKPLAHTNPFQTPSAIGTNGFKLAVPVLRPPVILITLVRSPRPFC